MDAAYDDEEYVDDRTIDSHIKRLRIKFKANDVEFDHGRDALWCRLSLQGSMSVPLFRASSGLLSQSSRRCRPNRSGTAQILTAVAYQRGRPTK